MTERIGEIPQTGTLRKGAYSAAVVQGDHCFIAGQLPVDIDGKLQAGGIEAQVELVVQRLFLALEAAGFGRDDLVFVQVVLADVTDWAAMDRAYRQSFEGNALPARIAFGGALPPGAMVEMSANALRAPRREVARA